jgi:Domain of unknown function (DUF397)
MPKAIYGSSPITWRRTSFCGGGECVEVAQQDQTILVRDSKHPGQEPLRYTRDEFRAFAEGIKSGELDDLL